MTTENAELYTVKGWWSDRLIIDDLDAVAEALPDKVAAVTPRDTITYGELRRRSIRVALGLLELGV